MDDADSMADVDRTRRNASSQFSVASNSHSSSEPTTATTTTTIKETPIIEHNSKPTQTDNDRATTPLWWKEILARTRRDHSDFTSHDSFDDLEKGASDSRLSPNHTPSLPLHEDIKMAAWTGQPSIRGNTETTRMVLLTCASIGIAFTWGVEMTCLTKGQASFVWLAGPLSGLLVQPVIGVISDQSTTKWGRRRPFIAIGSIIVACSLLTLGFTQEIVVFLLGSGGIDAIDHLPEGVHPQAPHRWVVIGLAVLALYVTDFAINAVMSCARSLLVDTLPIEKQQDGAAWASRMSSLGHLIGYGAGALDLVEMFGPSLGDTQFKKLTFVAAATMLTTSGLTCWAVTEKVVPPSPADSDPWLVKLPKVFRQIWSTVMHLPPRIQAICWAVFWGWIGWFPFMFYSSTWVGETYFRYDVPEDARGSEDALGEMGRIGSYALTTYSVVTVLAAIILPIFVRSPFDDGFTHRPPASMARFAEAFEKSRPDLLTIWTGGNILFACAMLMAPFATSFRFATVLVTLCGIPWTVVTWAPTAFLGVEVNKLTAAAKSGSGGAGGSATNRRPSVASPGLHEAMRLERGPDDEKEKGSSSQSGELSGVYFGILNIYTTIPQFIGNLISSMVFAVLEPGKSPELAKDAHPSEHHSTDGPNAIAISLFIGALFAIVSAVATRKLKHV